MITNNNEPEVEYGGPVKGKTYGCVIATDGDRMIMLDADPEIYWFLAEYGNCPEEYFDSPSALSSEEDQGVWSCRYELVTSTNWDGERDVGFALVKCSKIISAKISG